MDQSHFLPWCLDVIVDVVVDVVLVGDHDDESKDHDTPFEEKAYWEPTVTCPQLRRNKCGRKSFMNRSICDGEVSQLIVCAFARVSSMRRLYCPTQFGCEDDTVDKKVCRLSQKVSNVSRSCFFKKKKQRYTSQDLSWDPQDTYPLKNRSQYWVRWRARAA